MKNAQTSDTARIGNSLHQRHGLADRVFVAKLDAVLRALQQRRQSLEFGKYLVPAVEQLIGEVHQHVALFHHFVFGHLADPVVRQVRPREEQRLRVEVADVVADEHLARTGDYQVQFVFLVKVPAHQRTGETVLAIDDGQPVVVIHQLVRGVGHAGGSGHDRALFLLSPGDHASLYAGCASFHCGSKRALSGLHQAGNPAELHQVRLFHEIDIDNIALQRPITFIQIEPFVQFVVNVDGTAKGGVTGGG